MDCYFNLDANFNVMAIAGIIDEDDKANDLDLANNEVMGMVGSMGNELVNCN